MSIQKPTAEQAARASRRKDVPYFHQEIGSSLTPASRQLFEVYSGVPASGVETHIYKIVSGRFESILPLSPKIKPPHSTLF